MNDTLVRALSGAVFISIIIGSLYFGIYAGFVCLGLFAFLGLYEYFQLFKKSELVSVSPITGTFLGMMIFAVGSLAYIGEIHAAATAAIIPLLFISLLTELWRKKKNPLINSGIQLLGIFYVAFPFMVMVFIQATSFLSPHSQSKYSLIFMFLMIWSNDTFAYLSGRWFGKHKLFERISPKKTWEGTIGGILMTVLVAVVIAWFSDKQDYIFWICSALIIAPCAIFGDLLESLFKRSLNIKDSGNIMPGHGGILDRFDAALFAAPFFFCWWLFYNYFCA